MDNKTFLKAKVTSKKQITIPKEICEILDINEGEKVTFVYENNKIIFDIEKEKCFACNGSGLIEKNECFLCEGEGKLYKDIFTNVHKLIGQISKNSLKYNVWLTLQSQEIKDGSFSYKEVPTINLKSNKYPEDEILRIQDEIQKIIIKFEAPKSIQDASKLCVPSDKMLDTILNTLNTTEAKEEVYKWFRMNN